MSKTFRVTTTADPEPEEKEQAKNIASKAEREIPKPAAPTAAAPDPDVLAPHWQGPTPVLCLAGRGPLADAVARTGAYVNGLHCSAREALAAIRAGGIDFAVLDINLHGWGAFRLAEALQSRRTPFVFATGYELTVIPEQWCDIGLWEKPFEAADLISALPLKSKIGRYDLQPAHLTHSGVARSELLNATEVRITH